MTKMRDFLVFEADDHAGTPPGYIVQDAMGRTIDSRTGLPVLDGAPVPYRCIGAVTARDEAAAAQAMVGATRRVGKYAVIEATFLDFTKALGQAPEGEAPTLNP